MAILEKKGENIIADADQFRSRNELDGVEMEDQEQEETESHKNGTEQEMRKKRWMRVEKKTKKDQDHH